jgi:hypothetical protein
VLGNSVATVQALLRECLTPFWVWGGQIGGQGRSFCRLACDRTDRRISVLSILRLPCVCVCSPCGALWLHRRFAAAWEYGHTRVPDKVWRLGVQGWQLPAGTKSDGRGIRVWICARGYGRGYSSKPNGYFLTNLKN